MCKEDSKAIIRRLREKLEVAKKQIALLQEKSEK